MNKKQLIAIIWIIISLYSPSAFTMTFEEMLSHKASASRPFLGYCYKNIKRVSRTPDEYADSYNEEAGSGGQTDIGLVDLEGDGKNETIKAIWSHGVTDHALTLELCRDNVKLATLKPSGIQPNFKIEDLNRVINE